ncbi:hypothetical protein KSP39_PZI020879 [Platanthera zijinensis]|uniref:Uncharacterized protein n=1 Tax=Platanthera zijinensis TaxID=2320716 RepID=A0AAP0AZK9_9ASPA
MHAPTKHQGESSHGGRRCRARREERPKTQSLRDYLFISHLLFILYYAVYALFILHLLFTPRVYKGMCCTLFLYSWMNGKLGLLPKNLISFLPSSSSPPPAFSLARFFSGSYQFGPTCRAACHLVAGDPIVLLQPPRHPFRQITPNLDLRFCRIPLSSNRIYSRRLLPTRASLMCRVCLLSRPRTGPCDIEHPPIPSWSRLPFPCRASSADPQPSALVSVLCMADPPALPLKVTNLLVPLPSV